MRKGKLTSRQKEIILMLCDSSIDSKITISKIAEKLNLSSRTVLREMPKIEKWLDENGFTFIKKPGVGLMLDENLDNLQLMRELLDIETVEKEYTKDERKQYILGELLTTSEPLKLFYFTSKLKVSDGTLSNDLDRIEHWLYNVNLSLVRKPGLGIYVEGKEKNKRQALINLLHETLDGEELVTTIKSLVNVDKNKGDYLKISVENRLLKFIDRSIITGIESSLHDVEKSEGLNLADSAYVGLIVHLSLAIQRIKNGENITMKKDLVEELRPSEEYKNAEKIADAICKRFNIHIPESEIGYITMHLKGARIRLDSKENRIDLKNLDVMKLSDRMIAKAEELLDSNLRIEGNLLVDLANHLGPAISRLTMKLNIRNPLLEDMKNDYPKIFEISKEVCNMLQDITDTVVPESEVAYIAMHFAAAYEQNISVNGNIRVVVACPTGIGTSRLVAARLKKDFPNLEIVETISAININENDLIEKDIDFIISTIHLDTNFNYICINPMLDERDISLINNEVKKIRKNKKYKKVISLGRRRNSKLNIDEIVAIGQEVIKVVNSFKSVTVDKISDLKELILVASKSISSDPKIIKEIMENLYRREILGSTYLECFNIMLLHCKSTLLDELRVGVIKIKDPVDIGGNKIVKNAVYMVMPENSQDYKNQISCEISGALIERKDFLEKLLDEEEQRAQKAIEEVLSEFYYKKMKQNMEEWENGIIKKE